MKIIGEKGRLFGKLSVIDLLVLILLAAAVVFVALKLVNRSTGPVTATANEPVIMTYTVRVREVDPTTYEVVKRFVDIENGLKDQLLTGSTLANGYVIDCVAVPHVDYVETADGQVKRVVAEGEDTRLDLYFTLQSTITNTVTNAVGSQEVRAGMPQVVKTAHFEFQVGMVMDVEWSYESED